MSDDGSLTLANASKQLNNVGSSDVVDKPSLTLDKGPEVSQPPPKSIRRSDDVSQNSGRDGTKGIRYVPSPTVFKLILIVFSRTHGLSSVPTHLQYLRQEVGLSGEPWDNLGKEWRSLASLWLCAEMLLLKSTRSDQTFTEIHKSNIPKVRKDWMCSKNMKTDSPKPADSFGRIFT